MAAVVVASETCAFENRVALLLLRGSLLYFDDAYLRLRPFVLFARTQPAKLIYNKTEARFFFFLFCE